MLQKSYDNIRLLNKAITRQIRLAIKIDTEEHPQQVDLALDILRFLDKIRENQISVTRDYRRTADSLRLERSIRQSRTTPSVPLGDFLEGLEE